MRSSAIAVDRCVFRRVRRLGVGSRHLVKRPGSAIGWHTAAGRLYFELSGATKERLKTGRNMRQRSRVDGGGRWCARSPVDKCRGGVTVDAEKTH